MNNSHPQHTDLFAVFLAALLGAILLLTLLVLQSTHLLSSSLLIFIAAGMMLAALLLLRGLFPIHPHHRLWKRLAASTVSICIILACLLSSRTALLLSHSLSSMFGSLQEPITAPLQSSIGSPFTVYLGGSDTRSSTLTKSRYDVNILAVISPATRQILLVNTPRDYYVPNPAGKGAKDKLTHCGLYGADNAKAALSALYGIPIDYGAVINFAGFRQLIDAIGGITVTSDIAFTTSVGSYPIVQGKNHLDGAQALAFARERKHLPQGDNARGKHQMQVLTAMLRQCVQSGIGSRLPTLLTALEGTFTTDMPISLLSELARTQLSDIDQWELFTLSVTGTDGTARCWSSAGNAYVMFPDSSVNTAGKIMEQMLQGAVITAEMLP